MRKRQSGWSVASWGPALAFGLGACTIASASLADPGAAITPEQIEGKSFRLERSFLVVVHAPIADVDRVIKSVVAAVGLDYGKYDQVAYLDAVGVEQFRPIEGSKAGAQRRISRVPTKVVSFSVVHDAELLHKALEAVYSAHSYEEPVIYVSEVWRTRSKDPDEH